VLDEDICQPLASLGRRAEILTVSAALVDLSELPLAHTNFPLGKRPGDYYRLIHSSAIATEMAAKI